MPKVFNIIGCVLACMLLFVACSDEYVFQDHKVIPNEKWKADNDLTFVLTISDTTTSYRLGFTIRYNDKYAYQNLYMFLKTTLPNGKQVLILYHVIYLNRMVTHWEKEIGLKKGV